MTFKPAGVSKTKTLKTKTSKRNTERILKHLLKLTLGLIRPKQKSLGLMLAFVNGLFRPKVSFNEFLARILSVSFRPVLQICVSRVTLVQVLVLDSGF